MSDIQPIGYDAINEIVLIPGGGYKARFFIEEAITRFHNYGDPTFLLWAVEAGLPQLMESIGAREIFKRLILTGKTRRKGERPSVNIRSDKLRQDLIKRVWFHYGRGLPIYNNPESESANNESACDLAAKELLCSASHAYEIWAESGGHDAQDSAAKLVAKFWKDQGKRSR